MAKMTKVEDEKRVMVRMPIWIYNAIEELAQEDLRSINAEIITLISKEIEARYMARNPTAGARPPGSLIRAWKNQYLEDKARAEEEARQHVYDDDEIPF